ncbi:hypothetical protein D3C78_1993270 [compost metagenome]
MRLATRHATIEHDISHQTDQQPPERATDAKQLDIGGSGEKGDQRSLAGLRVGHRAGEATANGA